MREVSGNTPHTLEQRTLKGYDMLDFSNLALKRRLNMNKILQQRQNGKDSRLVTKQFSGGKSRGRRLVV